MFLTDISRSQIKNHGVVGWMVPTLQKKYAHVLMRRTWENDLIWKKKKCIFANLIEDLKMRSS